MSGRYTVKHMVAVVTIVVALIGCAVGYLAVRDQTTGVAVYWEHGDELQPLEVRRDASPAEFKTVVASTWKVSACCFVVAALGLLVYRKLSDEEYK